ncbi:hypothetical protein GCM10010441_62890 [Kitasatospora paracochleata]|uniref:Uncharacterized protein n=1 Tax=Kitasatospora paracochleata TaxID=58354 RepID=A0ABT1J331_9ACTN|nr:hypothetical protein [Kitasatospora paracochleata]MCP2311837.1 hypothetical protein [Kitasatospora paracochleata]
MKLRVLAPITLATVLAAGPATAAANTNADSANACRTLPGRSLQLSFDDGLVMRFDYAADGKTVSGTILAPGDTGGEVTDLYTAMHSTNPLEAYAPLREE